MTKTEEKSKDFDGKLLQELESVEYHSGNETVECKVLNVDKISEDAAEITFETPRSETFTKRSKIPEQKYENVLLNRLLEETGFTLATAEELVGAKVPFTVEDGEYNCEAEKPNPHSHILGTLVSFTRVLAPQIPEKNGSARYRKSLQWAAGIVGIPIVTPLAYMYHISGKDMDDVDYMVPFFATIIFNILWVACAYVVYAVFQVVFQIAI